MASATFYIFICGVFGIFNRYLYFSLALLTFEIVTLVVFKWNCPLTIVAKDSDPHWKDGDDIFLPQWLATHNKKIFGSILVIGLALLLLRSLNLL